MSTFTVEVKDEGVQSLLQTLQKRMGNLQPVFSALGGDMAARVHRRFDSSTGPDGTPWTTNAQSTLDAFAGGLSKGHFKKSGDLNRRGHAAMSSKKPLIGQTKDLSRQIGYTATSGSLTLFSTPVYAAIHQFGGQAGRGHKVKIPARPFMPVKADGSLYPDEQRMLLTALEEFLTLDL